MLFPSNSKIAVFNLRSVNLHGSRINFLTSMLFYFSEKSNPYDNTLTEAFAYTGGNKKCLAMRKRVKMTVTKGVFFNSTQEKRDQVSRGLFLNGNTLVNEGPPTLVSREIEKQRS